MRIGIAKRGGGGGGGAPTSATYVIQTANASLPSAQVLDDLAAGIIKVSAAGVLQTATAGTDYIAAIAPLVLASADVVEQRNSTTAQGFYIYNTYTSGTSYERAQLEWSSNVFRIHLDKGSGGGSYRNFVVRLSGFNAFTLDSNTAVFGVGVQAQGGLYLGLSGNNARMNAPASGNIQITNNGGTDFGLLQFGGATSSFPALKRSTTYIQVRLADDSAFVGLHAAHVTTAILTVGTLPGTPITGMRAMVSDSNAASFTAGIGAVVAAGGSTVVPVVYDGTNWRIG